MGQPAARQGDRIVAVDTHLVVQGGSASPVPHPFTGVIDGGLSSDVRIKGAFAATLNSTATNTPSHVPIGGQFAVPPTNKGTIVTGSATVFINKKPVARAGDSATTCNDPIPLRVGTVVAVGEVLIG